MLKASAAHLRAPKTEIIQSDLVIVGGGLAGTCCAITAARAGIRVVLAQDRPVLGGNSSSEVRLWVLGATSHMGNNNRWAREGGVVDEILVENTYRNPEGNGIIYDTILLEKVLAEPNIRLLLNTAVYEAEKSSDNLISKAIGFCSQNSTRYELTAPLFCDASGDGILGFLSGAAFRMGAESADEFDEPFAPSEEYGNLLGHSIYFMTKDVGKPVKYVAPDYALKDITKIPRYRKFSIKDQGAHFWWIEYGGRLDTVHDTELIKWELWKVVYGVWDYMKNSGTFPEAETMTLEWVGHIPGKRESRRFEGPYILKQSDFVQQQPFEDAVSFGGWAVDLHPADGVFSEKPGCNQYHSKGVYSIPYRTMYSRNIDNLFLAGRIISASHVAMGSSRVMATCAHNAQAVGMAAALATQNNWLPADLLETQRMQQLQQALLKSGQHIPFLSLKDEKDLASKAQLRTKHSLHENPGSTLTLHEIPFNGEWHTLIYGSAQMLPLTQGAAPRFETEVQSESSTTLTVSLRISSKAGNFTPDIVLATRDFDLSPGRHELIIDFEAEFPRNDYGFVCFHENKDVSIRTSQARITGILSVFNKHNRAVSNFGKQEPDPAIGFESFEFWVPGRRPDGANFAMKITPGLSGFGAENITNGVNRPFLGPNAWVASPDDPEPELTLSWPETQTIQQVDFAFDTDFDHPMESAIWGHPERIMPFTVQEYRIFDENHQLLYTCESNHQTLNRIRFDQPVKTRTLNIRFKRPGPDVPVAVFGLRCYGPE
ncbi:MAG: FAD-dependent oxidoreductase [Bacteroidia bacterium]